MLGEEREEEEKAQTVESSEGDGSGISRRDFLRGLGASGLAATVSGYLVESQAQEGKLVSSKAISSKEAATTPVPITLKVNGKIHTIKAMPCTTLLSALRNYLDITGPKETCDRGACGACTVLVDGRAVNSCMMLALDAVGKEILTVEGLVKNGKLHPIQEAMWYHDGVQCGFCTPGFVMSIYAQLRKKPDSTLDEIKRACSGNICRCGAYQHIFEAAMAVVKRVRG